MSSKRTCLIWCIITFTAFYIVIILNFTSDRAKFMHFNGLNPFYQDIGMRRFDHDLLIQQSFHVQGSFEKFLTGESFENDIVDASKDTENSIDVKSEKHMKDEPKLNSTEKLVVEKKQEQFYRLRERRVNPFDFNFLETGESICDKNEQPYLVILCLTKFYDVETREAIRDTWGSVAKTKKWPGVDAAIPAVKLVFLLGSHENSLVKKTIIEDEKQRFGDIVVADFKDSYFNLTLKVMMGLKWVSNYCPSATFVVKIDQDTFLHVVNLFNYLHFLPIPKEGVIIGYRNVDPKVMRTGKWRITTRSFPLSNYPNYTNGNCYVISGNVVPQMFEAAEKMPYIWVEDAFITGIVRKVLGVKLYDHKGFTKWNDKPPRLCGFHNGVRIAATNSENERKRNVWQALSYVNLRNCYDVKKHLEI